MAAVAVEEAVAVVVAAAAPAAAVEEAVQEAGCRRMPRRQAPTRRSDQLRSGIAKLFSWLDLQRSASIVSRVGHSNRTASGAWEATTSLRAKGY